jgi:hypothetical protein
MKWSNVRTALPGMVLTMVILPLIVQAQLTVVQGSAMNMTPLQLVQNYLVGPGITINNVTFNGSFATIGSDQIGTFETAGNATSQLGLEGGILMTSGKANLAIGPNNKANAGYNTGGSGDPDLDQISATSTFDKGVLEFDFIPQFDTIRFRYVFASEEFFEFCNQINDAFGFFLSGPGINGPFTNNALNIALMPGSQSVYVTINNICANVMSRWDNAGGVEYQYDGLTHIFTAWHVVQPCSTYHIKLAIADAVDHIYDSGVFLEENSFSSPGVTLNTNGSIPALGELAVEDCNDVAVNFLLSSPLDYAFTVNYQIGGTAINGTDYALIPDHVVFQAGTDSVALIIHPLSDLQPEGNETVIITVNQVSCNGSVTADTVQIADYLPMEINQNPDTVVCHGEEVELVAIVTGGIRPYLYQWNVSPATDSLVTIVAPVGNNICFVRVRDVCNHDIYDTAMILVHPVPLANAGQNATIPNGTGTTLQGSASGGYGSYSYSWTSNPPGFSSNIPDPPTGNLTFTTIFTLVVTDLSSGCQSLPSDVIIAVEGGPLSVNPVAQPAAICLGDTVTLFALAGGGSGLYTYTWSSNPPGFSSTQPAPLVIPSGNTSYSIVVNDGFNQMSGNTSVIVHPQPLIRLGPADTTICIYDTVILNAGNPGSTYEWSNGAESQKIMIASTGIGFEVQTYTVLVTNENGCTDSATINVIFSFSACTGIDELNGDDRFTIFPNPASDAFTFRLNIPDRDVALGIYNMTGSEVLALTFPGLSGKGFEKNISIAALPAGAYFIRIRTESFTGIKKLIVR